MPKPSKAQSTIFTTGMLTVLVLCILFFCSGCENTTHRRKAKNASLGVVDLDSIKRRGTLIVLTENSSSTYFLYRNQASGFDYEMALAYAKYLGVKLEIKLVDDVDRMLDMLRKGEADIAASNLTITPQRADSVCFSTPIYQTRQVLIQRKIEQPNKTFSLAISDSSQLGSIPIWVHRYSSFYERLSEISRNTQTQLKIEEAPGEISTDDLIRLVDDGAIPATITDENLASIELRNYSNIDASVAVSAPQDIAWAIRKDSPALLASLNDWLAGKDGTSRSSRLYKKYFNEEAADRPGSFVLPKVGPGAISAYDSLFKMYSPQLGWDWRMLASIAYHESHFNPQAQSWSGAYGLMQLMPQTSVRFGCTPTPTPECSVQAATKYIKYLQNMWLKRVPNSNERIKFVLSSYNIGQGHIIDAQNLARELGMKDTIWDGNVAEALLLKQQEKYYTMSCVKHGYCNAREPFIFVQKIIGTYDLYRSVSQE